MILFVVALGVLGEGDVVPPEPLAGVALSAENAAGWMLARTALRWYEGHETIDYVGVCEHLGTIYVGSELSETFGDVTVTFKKEAIGLFVQSLVQIGVDDIPAGFRAVPWRVVRDNLIGNIGRARQIAIGGLTRARLGRFTTE